MPGDDQAGLHLLDGLSGSAAAEHGVEHVLGDDWRAAAKGSRYIRLPG
ncbi:hypothetical protein OHB07_28570 [Streptomyces sp. NBC_00111]|nr:hypothetical protein [Streptomyces sp. NBC_01460]